MSDDLQDLQDLLDNMDPTDDEGETVGEARDVADSAPGATGTPSAPNATPTPPPSATPSANAPAGTAAARMYVKPDGSHVMVYPEHEAAALESGLEPTFLHVMPDELDPDTAEPRRVPVPRSHLAAARESGLVPEEQYNTRQALAAAKREIPTTALGALARGAASTFSVGAMDEIAGSKDALLNYLKNWDLKRATGAFHGGRDTYRLEESANKEQRPTEYTIGQGLGLAAGLGIGGPAKSVLGAAARGVGLGAVAGAAGGTEYPDPEKPELSLPARTAISAVLGGGLGAGGYKLGEYLGPKIAAGAEKFAGGRAAKAVTPNRQSYAERIQARNGGPEKFGQQLLEQGIVKGGQSFEQLAKNANHVAEQSGAKIGDVMKEIDAIAGTQKFAGVSFQNIVRRINEEVINKIRGHGIDDQLADKLQREIVTPMFDAAKAQGGKVDFTWLHKARQLVDEKAYTKAGVITNEALSWNANLVKIRRIMERELFNEAGKVVKEVRPDLLPSYAKAKEAYQVAMLAKEGLAKKISAFSKNRNISPTDYYSGGVGASLGATTAGFAGISPWIGGVIGGTIAGSTNHIGRTLGNQTMAAGANWISKLIEKNPTLAQKLFDDMNRLGLIGAEQ